MSQRISLNSPEFGRLFAKVQESWFRLETFQHYDVSGEQEQFDAFQAGESAMPYDPADEEWSAMVAGHVAAGRKLQRVHIVVEPLTAYVQYEVAWGYQPSLSAGEDIRVIACEQGSWPEGLPKKHDFWLLDSQLWVMAYDDNGRPLHADHVTDDAEVAQHRAWRDRALALSAPVGEFIARTAQLRERTPA